MSNTLCDNHATRGGSVTSQPYCNVDSRPKLSVAPFYLLWGLVFITLFVPPLAPGSSIRIDTLAVFFLLPFWILLRGKIVYDPKCRPVILAFAVLFIGVAIALFLQFFFLVESLDPRYIINLQGYLRPFLFALLAAVLISSSKNALSLARLILIGIIIHQIVVVIDYVNLQPISSFVNLFYRGDIERGGAIRALGAFNRVHGLAYFSLYSFLFSLCIVLQTQKTMSINRLAMMAMFSSLTGLLLSFSRGAWIVFFISLCFIFVRPSKVKYIRKLITLSIFGFIIIFSTAYINPVFWAKIVSYYNSIVLGVSYLIGSSSEEVGFISGRLDWGWKHAIEGWKQSPLFGDLSIGFEIFVGDGGYTERLVHHGLIGLISFLVMLIILWVGVPRRSGDRGIRKIYNNNLRLFVVSFLFAMLATGMMKERTVELLPVMLITLVMIPTKYEQILLNHEKPKGTNSII